MQRRRYLQACLGAGVASLAGCTDLGLVETRDLSSAPPVLDNRPDAVYFPTHVDGMELVGMAEHESGDYAAALTYTYPHRFWRVDATTDAVEDATLEAVKDGDDVHLMAVVWDPKTERTLPESGVSVDISMGGDPLDEQVIYPMLSPRMGFHYGANFALDGDGEYTVDIDIGGTNVRRTGAYQGRFVDAATITIPFEFSASKRDEIPVERTTERAGEAAAPPVMDMAMPLGIAPAPDSLPGQYRGTTASGDAEFAVTTLKRPPEGSDGDGTYLAVSARTPYNELLLPAMALEARLRRDGETVFEGSLERTFDDSLNYHYGAVVGDIAAGDELVIDVRTHPQIARHEGYETAFLDMPSAELTI
ncbi:hypothetical protein [Natronomonas sp.]|uniref:DUF7350 domain-containing protein n=1 Tax=Natronomonas sp. TaxID=2184060 RepID=UPI003989AA9D